MSSPSVVPLPRLRPGRALPLALAAALLLSLAPGPAAALESGSLPPAAAPARAGAALSPGVVADRLKDALDLFALGRTDAAIFALQQLSADDPANVTVLLKLAELAIAKKNWAYAISVLDKAAKLKPTDIPTRQVLMDIFKAYQMPVQEIRVGREILALEPNNLRALNRMSTLYRDLDMPTDEIEIRSTLAELHPDDEANLNVLAHLLWESGEPWEEIVVHRKLRAKHPEKQRYLRRLAMLYGHEKVKDWYLQLETIEKVPDWRRDRTMRKAYDRAVKTYRKTVKAFDRLESTQRVGNDLSREYESSQVLSENLYMWRPLRSTHDPGIWSRYTHTDYRGRRELAGKRTVDAYAFQGRQLRHLEKERSSLLLGLGATHVAVGGNVWSRDGEPLSPRDYPFTENRSYGGTAPTAMAEFQRLMRPRLTLRLSLSRDLMDEIDAQVRMFERTAAAAECEYSFSDLTLLRLRAEKWYISDGNEFFDGRFELDRYLLGTRPVHDFKGHRESFILTPPASSLRVRYRVDYKDHITNSPYYQAYQNEVEQELLLTGELYLSPMYYFLGEGIWGSGTHTVSNLQGYKAGVGYRDRYTQNEILLEYCNIRETVTDASQPSATLRGLSIFDHVQLSGRWHF